MIVNIKLSTKHLHKFLYKTKNAFEKCFQKISSIHKRLCWSMHANIKSSDNSASHHSQRQKFIHVLQEHYTRRKKSIASSHSSKLSVSIVLIRSYGWYKAMLSANLPYYSSLKDLVLRGSLVFHCSYINTVSIGRDATSKRRSETIRGLRKTKQMPHIKTKWTPTRSMSTYNTAQTV